MWELSVVGRSRSALMVARLHLTPVVGAPKGLGMLLSAGSLLPGLRLLGFK